MRHEARSNVLFDDIRETDSRILWIFFSLRYLHYAMNIVHFTAVADFQLEPYGSG